MINPTLIGVTERADPTVNLSWLPWVKSGKPAILITKRPDRLLLLIEPYHNLRIIVHCTITGLGGTTVEPGIPSPKMMLDSYHTLCATLGKDRVVLRIDPIVSGIVSVVFLADIRGEAEGRVRISFLDQYAHVKERFDKAHTKLSYDTFHAPLDQRLRIWESLGKPEVCAEPGLPVTPCVSVKDCEILGVAHSLNQKGQRKECGCLANKTEIIRLPPKCTYGCLYCYWRD